MIPLFKVYMDPSVGDLLNKTLYSGYITQGPKVTEFEYMLEKDYGFPFVTTNSCTSAITLALRLAGVGPGDEVITTPMTCQATNTPILASGAIPIWADVFSRTGLIDPSSVARAITSKTKAIMCVDWGGAPADLDKLMNIAGDHGIKLIEDAAHAFGAAYFQDYVGHVADFTCFSFQAIKHLTTGDGGAITCSDPEDLKRAKALRWFGIDRDKGPKDFRGEIDVVQWGYKFHMNDLNASIGIGNLPAVSSEILDLYMQNGQYYKEHLDERFVDCSPRYEHESASWVHTVLLQEDRDFFKAWAEQRGVQVSQVHWRNDKLTAFKPYEMPDLVGVDEFSERMICLPSHWDVDAAEVCSIVNKFWE